MLISLLILIVPRTWAKRNMPGVESGFANFAKCFAENLSQRGPGLFVQHPTDGLPVASVLNTALVTWIALVAAQRP
jgi:hypothetical protein